PTPEDVKRVLQNRPEAVRLYRTQFLYIPTHHLPTQQHHFHAYKTLLHNMEGKPLVVPTLHIGAHKQLPYLHLPRQMNPFLP
ncbi:putative PEP-binding protein, partial [Bacillus sp. WP8]|uniref:putative PEP-binding protein n=1 Tax=Bacillus sp. WP8 TaxID=756828 RepID=UPI0028D8578A